MALINCSECGRSISSEAAACPGCGRAMRSTQVSRLGAGGTFEAIGTALCVTGVLLFLPEGLGRVAALLLLAGIVVFLIGRFQ